MASKYSNLKDIKSNIITPRYRLARINKLLIYPMLGITKSIYKTVLKTKPFTKLLAIKKDKKYLLQKVMKSKINLVITNKDYELLNKNQKQIIDIDLNASNLYSLITNQNHNKDKKIGVIFK